MGWGSAIKAFFKIGSKGSKTIVLTGKDATKFIKNFGGDLGKNVVKFGDDAAKVIVKAGPAIGNGVKAISVGAVALGAAIIAGLSGFIGYLMSNNKLVGPFSALDLILIAIGAVIAIFVAKYLNDIRNEHKDERLKKSRQKNNKEKQKKVKY